jgi:hypothetical protein
LRCFAYYIEFALDVRDKKKTPPILAEAFR